MEVAFHYPPELLQLMVDTIPRLCRSKRDVLVFFQGAGVAPEFTSDLRTRVDYDRENIDKFEIARTVLTRLNERGERALRERREILKRVVEYEDFSTCWPTDELKAKGLVGEIRRVVGVKDAFTRMQQERDRERQQHISEREAEAAEKQQQQAKVDAIKVELFALFALTNPHKRGKALEGVLNGLFKAHGILVRDAFTRTGDSGEGIIEQIDGVIELDGHLHFIEMKWWDKPVGVAEIAQHMMRVFIRPEGRAIIISASHFTAAAIASCKEALSQKAVILCRLEEIVQVLERRIDLRAFLKSKIDAAIIHQNVMHEPIARGDLS